MLAVVGSMYAFTGAAGFLPEGTNPARGIEKYKENRRERFLTGEELERLGKHDPGSRNRRHSLGGK